jgi:hypothetical protein
LLVPFARQNRRLSLGIPLLHLLRDPRATRRPLPARLRGKGALRRNKVPICCH